VRRRETVDTRPGLCRGRGDADGRHSLPVPLPCLSIASALSVPRFGRIATAGRLGFDPKRAPPREFVLLTLYSRQALRCRDVSQCCIRLLSALVRSWVGKRPRPHVLRMYAALGSAFPDDTTQTSGGAMRTGRHNLVSRVIDRRMRRQCNCGCAFGVQAAKVLP
jgi:hypothetical protein